MTSPFRTTLHAAGLGALLAIGVAAAGAAYLPSFSTHEAGFDEPEELSEAPEPVVDEFANWVRPDGPLRVGLQAGHWKAKEAPDELENIRSNGAYAAGVSEWQANLKVAEAAKLMLEEHGIVVDILPATVPPRYWADAFIAIHADDNDDTSVTGYKVASPSPRRDRSGRAAELSGLLEREYGEATGLPLDPNVTRNMRGYYAFNWRRYEHSVHPMTPSAILEMGFLSNPRDRAIFWRDPERAARGLADAVLEFLGLRAEI
jgi:N-acetylmuramoyl-L-alanine amidase-like protein